MNVKEWLHAVKCQKTRQHIATLANTTVPYMWQLAGGHRCASTDLAKRLAKASKSSNHHMHASRILELDDEPSIINSKLKNILEQYQAMMTDQKYQ